MCFVLPFMGWSFCLPLGGSSSSSDFVSPAVDFRSDRLAWASSWQADADLLLDYHFSSAVVPASSVCVFFGSSSCSIWCSCALFRKGDGGTGWLDGKVRRPMFFYRGSHAVYLLVSLSWSGCEAAMVVLRAAVRRFGWSRGTAGKRGGRRRGTCL